MFYINYYFSNILYDENFYMGKFEAPDSKVECDFEYNRNTKECKIWNNSKLTFIKDADGKEYGKDNWRAQCFGGQGLLIFAESLRKRPGEMYLTFFFTVEVDEKMSPYVRI